VLIALSSLAPRVASADESAYCAKARARAASESALLFAPTAHAAGIKFPSSGITDTGTTSGAGYQFRASLSFSPLDIYRGFQVRRAGEADCKAQEAGMQGQQAVLVAPDYASLVALRREAEYLDAEEDRKRDLVAKTAERVAAKATTVLEAIDVRRRAAELDRRRAEVAGEIARLEARGVAGPPPPLEDLATEVRRTTMEHERQLSHLRSLDGWSVSVAGGIIPQAKPVDAYGVVQIGINLGAFSRSAAETRYVEAREREVAGARYEVSDQLRRVRAHLHALREQGRREADIVDRELAALASARAALEGSGAPGALHAAAVVTLESMLAGARRAYLTALVAELSTKENDPT
jgi:hypothetical protein